MKRAIDNQDFSLFPRPLTADSYIGNPDDNEIPGSLVGGREECKISRIMPFPKPFSRKPYSLSIITILSSMWQWLICVFSHQS